MTILDKIVVHKRSEVADAKVAVSLKQLEQQGFFTRKTVSLKDRLLDKDSSGIIAEFKRKSPSKGVINDSAAPDEVVRGYEQAGAAGSSVLTDTFFFGGCPKDLMAAREVVNIPLLRKDFMIDEYQFVEARSWGADLVLLIASILTPAEVKQYTELAKSLDLEVLLELHDERELNHVNHLVDMVGINNRNLKTFEVDIEQSIRMAEKLGNDFVKVAESGISKPQDVVMFRQNGFQGFLIGETFMKTTSPEKACSGFIDELRVFQK
jgi:indole-3-glycerol phosphate synthase